MQSIGRPRQYVSAARLYAMFPLLRFSYDRGAYVLRFVGGTRGPVLRRDRRRGQREFNGPDRREGGVDLLASRPQGSVRRIEVAATSRTDAAEHRGEGPAVTRRRQHGRQRPPRPHH